MYGVITFVAKQFGNLLEPNIRTCMTYSDIKYHTSFMIVQKKNQTYWNTWEQHSTILYVLFSISHIFKISNKINENIKERKKKEKNYMFQGINILNMLQHAFFPTLFDKCLK